MAKKRTTAQLIEDAARQHTNLNTWAAVVALMEGGLLYGAETHAAASKITAICQRESGKCLKRFDRAVAKAIRPTTPSAERRR